jgi:hypothetical protein
MLPTRTFLAHLGPLAAFLLLAGCVDAGATATTVGTATEEAPVASVERPLHDGETCAIDGLVLDEEHLPIPDAQVALVGGDIRNTRSALDGSFAFSYLPPGAYQVGAAKKDYESIVLPLECRAGEMVPWVITLVPLPPPKVPYLLAFPPQPGFLACSVGLPGGGGLGSNDYCTQFNIDSNGRNRVRLAIDNGTTSAAIYELEWQPTGAFGGHHLSLTYPQVRAGVNWTLETTGRHYTNTRVVMGASVMSLRFSVEDPAVDTLYRVGEATALTLDVRAASTSLGDFLSAPASDPSSRLVYQQPFTLHAAIFHNGAVPEPGFTLRDG